MEVAISFLHGREIRGFSLLCKKEIATYHPCMEMTLDCYAGPGSVSEVMISDIGQSSSRSGEAGDSSSSARVMRGKVESNGNSREAVPGQQRRHQYPNPSVGSL
jgi:hypothetical protein